MTTLLCQDILKFEVQREEKIPNRIIFSLLTFESFKWELESNVECILCGQHALL
jgi:hypothetical protein